MRTGRPNGRPPHSHVEAAEVFWKKVLRAGPDECWEWIGARVGQGYGRAHYNKKEVRAHRLSYFLAYGIWCPYLRHTCDNPPCVNPRHLIPGDHRTNMDDKLERDRQARGHGIRSDGLTEEQVRIIRSSGTPTRALAREFGVSEGTMCHVRQGRTWKHVREGGELYSTEPAEEDVAWVG